MADGSTRPYVGPIVDLSRISASPSSSNAEPPSRAKKPASKAGDDRTYLNVPFAEKDAAKSLGARWDAATKKWYVPAGKDVKLFSKWRSNA
ncbi:hypothetical protein D3871_13775 [Noviherbaspirillum saxi]|uniref:DUF5710 domain-containing protein n=1 Tax=Noviherbaspirillum saxi TaxID=2320863 RepID=A0A3A3FTU9_9BURK|nr:hypothetical protein D3871_13775 [Noviherbaspirillum saxi]